MAGATQPADGEARPASPRTDRNVRTAASTRIAGAGCAVLTPDMFRSCRGLALIAGPGPGELAIVLVRRDGAPVPLFVLDETDAVAEWRSIARDTGLALMVETGEGAFGPVRPQIGRLLLGEVRIRRRHGLLKGRRPRFLTRRKTGAMPVRPVIHPRREIGA